MQLTISSDLSNYNKILDFFQSQALKICEDLRLNNIFLKLNGDDFSQLFKFLTFSSSLYSQILYELHKTAPFPDAEWKIIYSKIDFDSNIFDFQFDISLCDLIPNARGIFESKKRIRFLIREWAPISNKGKRVVSLYRAYYATNILDKFTISDPNLQQNLVSAVVKAALK